MIVESVGEGVTDLKSGDHVLPVFTGECKERRHCKSEETRMHVEVRIEETRRFLLGRPLTCPSRAARMHMEVPIEETRRFLLGRPLTCSPDARGESIYHFVGTSTFSEYTVVHIGCLATINPAALLDKVCVLSCGISTGLGATLNVAKPTKGSTVAIFGLGAVSLAGQGLQVLRGLLGLI
ncbi:alcohol dehydrogenase-like [Rhododendron vialii]|uniref:alcohol dehydrogenase-like n=1 Tax=Rhododendron vialii TaxID=182163 RepID=UPI00265E0641|nr:alcohol dehydrogenase-like [Rhododendron vialii]